MEFISLAHARDVLEAWKDDYNLNRLHGSICHLTPSEFAKQRQKQGEGGAKL